MPRTRIREANIEDSAILTEAEFNEFFQAVVVTGTPDSTAIVQSFADFFPGQGLVQGAGGVTVITGSNLVTISGSAGGGASLSEDFIANGSVSQFDYVYITEVDNQVSPAKADSASTIEVVGLATAAAASGTEVSVTLKGPVEGVSSGLTTGAPLFLDATTVGDFTETPPSAIDTYILQVGHALNTTDVYVNVNSATATKNLGGLGFDLQSAYNNGNGVIQLTAGTPVIISGTEDDAQEDFKVIGSGTFTEALTIGTGTTYLSSTGITATSGTFSAGVQAGNFAGRNAIINGNFDIWQRGTSFNQAANGTYTSDRWVIVKTGAGEIDVARDSSVIPDGTSEYSVKLTVDTADASIAAGDFYWFGTRVEGFNAQRFGFGTADAQEMTLSFWVRSSVTGTYCVALRSSDYSTSYPSEYTIDSADTWERKSISLIAATTGSWLTTNGVGVRVNFALAVGSNFHGTNNTWVAAGRASTPNQVNWMATGSNTFYLSRVQLEVGEVATEFERRPIGTELALCQRYYEEGEMQVDQAVTTAFQIGSYTTFRTKKRAAPSISQTNVANNAAFPATPATARISIMGFMSNRVTIGTGNGEYVETWTADAEL